VKRSHRRSHDRVDGAGRGHDADLDVLVGVGIDELPIKEDAM
jgi:pyrimidine operon attenuation protein/uracil phosphoribosyltransferase